MLVDSIEEIIIGDPTDRAVFNGPVINQGAYQDFQKFVKELSQVGTILAGGDIITADDYGKGFFCRPTLVADVPLDHRLWKHEMFLPITMIHPVNSLKQAMQLANDSQYGLTAGFYGTKEETAWFFDVIEAGVTYANRPQGSSTGAWPGLGFNPSADGRAQAHQARTQAAITICSCTCTSKVKRGSDNVH